MAFSPPPFITFSLCSMYLMKQDNITWGDYHLCDQFYDKGIL